MGAVALAGVGCGKVGIGAAELAGGSIAGVFEEVGGVLQPVTVIANNIKIVMIVI